MELIHIAVPLIQSTLSARAEDEHREFLESIVDEMDMEA